jgi:hypothetical protein
MKPGSGDDDTYIYDARLSAIDASNRELVFTWTKGVHRIPVDSLTHWPLGSVGRLRLPRGARNFAFHTYVDPLLRRAPGLDEAVTNRWGWRLGERRFTVEAGILPGRGGAVVRRDTEKLPLDLPGEFRQFCKDCGLQPATVLRGFIADLCSLHNMVVCPREDGYSSNGSDERDMAKDYFRRAYGWVFDTEYAEQLLEASSRRVPHE